MAQLMPLPLPVFCFDKIQIGFAFLVLADDEQMAVKRMYVCSYKFQFLQCFDVVGWAEWWVVGVVICLERGAYLNMAKLMPLPLTVSCSSKI